MKTPRDIFRDRIENSPVPVLTAEAMLQAVKEYLRALADDDPDYDCPNSLTTRDCREAHAAIQLALNVFKRRT